MKRLRVSILFLATGVVFSSTLGETDENKPSTYLLEKPAITSLQLDEAVDEIINQYSEDNEFAGVLLIAQGSKTLHAKAYGEVFPGSGILHQLDSEWRWASVTKMLAGFLTMQEAERGNLEIDQTLNELIPNAPSHFEKVTIRQLMNHTSGLANPDQTPFNDTTGVYEWATGLQSDFDYCYRAPLEAAGKRFDYNACDFVVLADVLENVTGSTFSDLINDRIVNAYNLFSIRVVTQPDDDAQIVGTIEGVPVRDKLRLSNLSADASIVGKPEDLLSLTQLYLAGEIFDDQFLRQEFERGDPSLGYVALTVWGYQSHLLGCKYPKRIIERQGHLPGTKVLTLLEPGQHRSIVAFSNREETDWGWLWQKTGLGYSLASEVFCRS